MQKNNKPFYISPELLQQNILFCSSVSSNDYSRKSISNRLPKKYRLLIIIILGITISLLAYIKPIVIYTGKSMVPSINLYDVVLVYPLASFKKGDILAVDSPNGEIIIKRIAGVPGDNITRTENAFVLGGMVFPFNIEKADKFRISIPDIPNIIPPHHLFLAGDNNVNSFDSRYIGLIHFRNIRGKVVGIIPTGRLFSEDNKPFNYFDGMTYAYNYYRRN